MSHEPSGIEDAGRVELPLDLAHDGKARGRRSPDVDALFDPLRSCRDDRMAA